MTAAIDRTEHRRHRSAVFLSSFFFPGVGQFVQGRPLAGIIHVVLFLSCLTVFGFYAGRIMMVYYRFGFEFETYEVLPLPIAQMLMAFGIGVVVYVVNIVDALLGGRRQRQKARKRVSPPPVPATE